MPAHVSTPLSLSLLVAGAIPFVLPLPADSQALDSLVFRREAGYWENVNPRTEQLPGYRIAVHPDGALHFTVEHGEETGREERRRAGAEAVEPLFALAGALDLEGVPVGLAAAKPWCDIVITDAPTVAIGIARGGEVRWVEDYHGCMVDRDESQDALIGRLRELERTASRILDFEERFDALPLLDPS